MLYKALYSIALLAVAAAPVLAEAGDPPSRVARLNYRSGSVSFRPGSVDEWTEATLNYPLTTGDHLWTARGGRTEMHAGSTAIRTDSETSLSILNLDDRTLQLSLTQGSVEIHVRDLESGEIIEIDTPNAAVSLLRPGDYRVDADEDRNLTVADVREGEADVTAGDSTFPVRMRQSARITGMDQPAMEIGGIDRMNDFDRWCESRDQREERSESARHVSRGMTGYEDLDDYGAWQEVAPYGWVWSPARVSADWAPYHFGHWIWMDPWGWTWVDDEPWGFAPFHYGRWAYILGRWVWIPGNRVPRPVWSPALVVFAGGPGFGVNVGWFPLGPGEVYRPAYRASQTYITQVNVTNVNITNINVTNVRYVNRDVRGSVKVVPQEVFIHARPVGRTGIVVDPQQIERASIVPTPPIAPRRESVLGDPDRRRAAAPPERYTKRQVVARTAPPPPPVPFGARQRALEQNQGRPLDNDQMETLRRQAPVSPAPVRTLHPRNGWRPANAQGDVPPAPRTPAAVPAPPQPRQPNRPVLVPNQGTPRPIEPPRRVEPRDDRPFPAGRPRPEVPERRAEPPRERPAAPPAQPREERPAAQPAPAPRTERPAAQPAPAPRTERPQPRVERKGRPEPRERKEPAEK